ncbi:hypothetical protein MUK42_32548 [Musa troglodytarum]|uniref:Uncharacterized protein n=1 Tax=Musa troglodytarum TaxID=320322 RepID=A0A9E7JVE9_9LILI|nr:hypothetical protein MUK42_32548 [Musa troglodytarum]
MRHLSLNQNTNRGRHRHRGTETLKETDKDTYKQHIRRCGYVDAWRQDHGQRELGRFFRRWCSTPSPGKTKPESQRSKVIGKRKKICWAICR